MAANKDDATWLLGYVNDADMLPENPLEYDTDGPLFNIYLSVHKRTQNYTRRYQMDKWNKPKNTRDITGCIGESIQNWKPYLGTYKNTTTADIYIASQSIGGTSKTKYKILDRPWRLPPSKLL